MKLLLDQGERVRHGLETQVMELQDKLKQAQGPEAAKEVLMKVGRRVCILIASIMSNSVAPWPVAHQAPLSREFSSQEYWSGLPFPSPGESSQPRDQTQVSCFADSLSSDTRESPGSGVGCPHLCSLSAGASSSLLIYSFLKVWGGGS